MPRRQRDRAPKNQAKKWTFNIETARRAFSDCYAAIGPDLADARREGGEYGPMTAEELFWCVLDYEGTHFHPPQDFKTWLDATDETDEMVKVVPVVLPYAFYE